ncbi:helix-turn-helix domain-containing protein [Cuneatibacter caecimuris]|uniref:DNA-binding Xre family transcriptional regulator n=1 Tax=Cuneatibacter caecimuris TaxID=1796618 RepID=A0A4Q7PPT0_9FIRM|nr:helix-turn-helix transcriptional regulator [Cuneatibacter caecimuris]RZT02934.1 DNA-binding Xre family transcriptional regulator [Cuneatibacter caecimuris]
MRIRVIYHLSEIMYDRNLSERELSRMSGVSKTTINNINNGRKHPNGETLCMLASALKIPVGDLISYKLQ